MDNNYEKISKILRFDKNRIQELQAAMSRVTGKEGVCEDVTARNDELVRQRLDFLGLGKNVSALEVYDALISKIEADDVKIFEAIGLFSLRNPDTAGKIVDFVEKLHPLRKGYFLKYERATEFLRREPPKMIMKALGYKDVEDLIKNEDLLEVYSALRFLEDPDWLNKAFFKQYEQLTPEDFEERPIQLRALDPKWTKAAEKFVAKKYHNVSHLKEMGVIFVIQIFLGISGETLRLISLLLHYLNEVQYYSDLFKIYSYDGNKFSENIISLLRGDVINRRPPEGDHPRFLVIQRYLAKDDDNDWRLFEPHVNPEAIHWKRAEEEIVRIEELLPEMKDGLAFWKDMDWVGDYFKDEVGKEILVSFNLVDTVMALVKEKELIKYLYHHQEALWNKLVSTCIGEEKMIELMKKNMIKGWFEL
ncbi:MAG: hypothetical protein HZB99_03480 [Candidatus Harrisonbacteria bacterium]|nr:hypothetical protein [Candidatus Harrisonbacteria bacterium]